MKPKVNIIELFNEKRRNHEYIRTSAPMVRYSKLEFRTLLRRYNVDICFTPMIMADSFCQSQNARQNEFTTNAGDTPLIVQFAAKKSIDMLIATELIYPFADGVDLNCGCPQRWAVTSGYGCAMLKNPDLIYDIVHTIRRNMPQTFSCSVKMRLLQRDVSTTVDLCRQLEKCGVDFLTMHARTPWQKSSEPIDAISMSEIKKSLQIPVIANGDVKSLNDANALYSITNCDGIMAARGILSNPSLFTGSQITTLQCVRDWLDLAYSAQDRLAFQCFHHHLTFMMEKLMRKRQRAVFNNFTKKDQIFEFLEKNFQIAPQANSTCQMEKNILCDYDSVLCEAYLKKSCDKDTTNNSQQKEGSKNSTAVNNGKFFDEFCQHENMNENNSNDHHGKLDFMGMTIFDI